MIAQSKLKKALLLVLLITIFVPSYARIYDLILEPVSRQNLFNAVFKNLPNNVTGYTVQDTGYKGRISIRDTDLLLSFDQPSSTLRWDDTSQYRIRRADYIFKNDSGSRGDGHAAFFKLEHGVSVIPQQSLWLGRMGDLESFTIDFRFFARNVDDNTYIFSKVDTLLGETVGLQIFIHRGRIVCRFTNFFHDNGIARDITLLGRQDIAIGRWYHFAISFDRTTGKLSRYIDLQEDEVVFMTSDGTPHGQIMIPSFNRLSRVPNLGLAHIGRGFRGYLDEFRISYLDIDRLRLSSRFDVSKFEGVDNVGRIPFNSPGLVRSQVYQFNRHGTRIVSFDWDELLPDNTFVWFEFRISDYKFRETDSNVRWYRIGKGQTNAFGLSAVDGSELIGKYYQWRAHLIPSPDGFYAPTVSNVRLQYKPKLLLSPPNDFRIVSVGDGYVRLSWRKNIAPNLGGYKIYYGAFPDRFDGIITHINGKKLDNYINSSGVNSAREIEVVIDNRVIEENMRLNNSSMFDFPRIQNNVVYYFAISAYDTYKIGTKFNNESKLSHRVNGRPRAASQIRD